MLIPSSSYAKQSKAQAGTPKSLSEEATSQVPTGRTNLEYYLRQDQSFEKRSVGLQTVSSGAGDQVKNWDKQWEALSVN